MFLQVVYRCAMIHDLGWFNFGESLSTSGVLTICWLMKSFSSIMQEPLLFIEAQSDMPMLRLSLHDTTPGKTEALQMSLQSHRTEGIYDFLPTQLRTCAS
jgi:hypothetical protein